MTALFPQKGDEKLHYQKRDGTTACSVRTFSADYEMTVEASQVTCNSCKATHAFKKTPHARGRIARGENL